MGKSRYAPRTTTLTYLKRHLKLLVVAILCTVSPISAAEGMTLEVIHLTSTTAEQTLPMLKPFVAPGGTVTGKGQQLIVKTTKNNLTEIKTILRELDVAPRQLRISVTQNIDQVRRFATDSIHGRIGSGDVSAQVGQSRSSGGAEIRYRDSHGNIVGYSGARTRTNREDSNVHFVTALEGRPSFIFTGEASPYISQTYYGDQFGSYAQTNVDLVQTERGFYVTPRISGQHVNLEITTRLDEGPNRRNGVIQSRGVDTVVTGTLGEWIPLGGTNRQASSRQGEILASTRGTQDNAYEVWVKVELSP